MVPQNTIPVAADVLGTIGTTLWCIQLIPQIWYNWRQKKTDGLPGLMLFLWATSAVPFGIYAIVQNFNIPIQIQPQIFGALSLCTWAQILIYNNGWRVWTAMLTASCIGAAFGAIEALSILTLRGLYNQGVSWPVTMVGIIAAIVLAAGLIPPYFELWKRGGRVIGLNWFFLSIDWSGAFFSLMAVVAQQTFDVLGGSLYIICLLLEVGIFASHIIWRLRTRNLRLKAKLLGLDFDDLPEAKKYQFPTNQAAKSSRDDLETGGSEHGDTAREEKTHGVESQTSSQTSSPAPSIIINGPEEEEKDQKEKKKRRWFHLF